MDDHDLAIELENRLKLDSQNDETVRADITIEEQAFVLPDELIEKSLKITTHLSYIVKQKNKLEFVGNFIAGVSYPTKKHERNNKTIIIFACPSHETDIDNEFKSATWNPFRTKGDKWVKSFQHLSAKMDTPFPFEEFILIDMFPNRIWETSIVISAFDRKLSRVWLRNQIDCFNPHRIIVATKTYAKKFKDHLTFAFNSRPFEIVSHPGYTNREPSVVVSEWKKIIP